TQQVILRHQLVNTDKLESGLNRGTIAQHEQYPDILECSYKNKAPAKEPGLCQQSERACTSRPLSFQRRSALLRGFQRLLQIREDVVDMLDTDRQPHQIPRHTGLFQLLVTQLTVGGGSGVAGQ